MIFRGQQTGDVRSVELAPDGTHVVVSLRIARKHRQTVTDRCQFWVARPAVTGALLSVFARRPHRIAGPIATIGIRGTGVYVEVAEDHDYVCTCYGVTEIGTPDDPASTAVVEAGHHEARYVLAAGAPGARIQPAPFKNHTDAELTLIESLVGRVPEFKGDYEGYERPRRRTY